MVNKIKIAEVIYKSIGFNNKKEALAFIKHNNIKSNKYQNENIFINIVKMKRQLKNIAKVESIVNTIKHNINSNEDITITQTMSLATAKDIISKSVDKDKRLMFTLEYENKRYRSYFNGDTIPDFTSEPKNGSDTQDEILNSNVTSISVKEVSKTGNNTSLGAFFKYYNTTELDLERYSIFKTANDYDHRDNCLIYALIKSNKISDDEINTIRLYCKTRETSLKILHSISREFNIVFTIRKYRNDEIKIEKPLVINDYTETGKEPINIDLALYDNHWFLYEDVNITRFFINNYNAIKSLHPENIIDYKNVNKFYKNDYVIRKDRNEFLNSLSLIHYMYKNNLFKRIPVNDIMHLNFYNIIKNEEINITNIPQSNYRPKIKTLVVKENQSREIVDEDPEENEDFLEVDNINFKKIKTTQYIVFADFEATTMKTSKVNAEKHKAFMISYITRDISQDYKIIESNTFYGIDDKKIAYKFLDNLKPNSLIYFHNLKYDKNFIFDNLYITSYLEKEGQLYEIKALYPDKNYNIDKNATKNKTLIFRDSYKLISEPLSEFSDMFGLNISKEVFPYDFYNEENIKEILDNNMMSICKAKKTLIEEKHPLFDECIKNVTHTKTKFNALEFAKFYCERDVQVLDQGMMAFRQLVLKALEIDVFSKITISSIAEQYLINKGCYDDVYELSGQTQAFIQRSVFGGRVMIRRNSPIEVNEILQDFDACGLYASAMYTMKGFPIGKPTMIDESFDINRSELYYIEIELLDEYYNRGIGNKIEIPKNKFIQLEYNRHEFDYDFPLWGDKDNDGIIQYTNMPKNRKHVVNNDILTDLISFYKLELNVHYKINQGLIFEEGYNNKINKVMEFLYNERLKQKALKNKIQLIYKLIMNSSYGKTLTKYSDTRLRIFCTYQEERINSFIYRYYNNIKEISYTNKHTIIKLYNEYGKHWNCVHVGSAVLARSKAIMNKVFYTCHHEGLTPLYQDTDSIHIPEEQVQLLPKEFVGKNMCQFHCDFDDKPFDKKFKGLDKIDYNTNKPLVYSSGAIFVAKKCYIDILNHRQYPNKTIYHIRFKGQNEQEVIKTAEELKITPYELYHKILNGSEILFKDEYSSKPRFQQTDISVIKNRPNRVKKIKLNIDK